MATHPSSSFAFVGEHQSHATSPGRRSTNSEIEIKIAILTKLTNQSSKRSLKLKLGVESFLKVNVLADILMQNFNQYYITKLFQNYAILIIITIHNSVNDVFITHRKEHQHQMPF